MDQGSPRIMIVESFGSSLKSLSGHLSGFPLPLEFLSAADGLTALTQVQREVVDLLIIDSSLRGKVDGFELCRALRTSLPDSHIPIILILSGCLSFERSKGIAAGADLLLHRPIVKEELLRMLQVLLGRSFDRAVNFPLPAMESRPLRRLQAASA